jgi:hypothetical protein
MRILLTALISAILVGVAPAANASSSYAVTISSSATTLDLGHSFTLKGTVSPNAAGKSVAIQRKYAGGSWATITHATLSSGSRYSKTIKPTKAAVTSYRVVKAAAGSRHSGTSATKVVTVYRWRYLTDLPQASHDVGAEESNAATIMGRVYPHSVVETNNTSMIYRLGGVCTKFTGVVGMDDSSPLGATGTAMIIQEYASVLGSMFFSSVAADAYGVYATNESQLTTAVSISLNASTSTAGAVVVWGSPRVYCAS